MLDGKDYLDTMFSAVFQNRRYVFWIVRHWSQVESLAVPGEPARAVGPAIGHEEVDVILSAI
jgi:hypothetical protein